MSKEKVKVIEEEAFYLLIISYIGNEAQSYIETNEASFRRWVEFCEEHWKEFLKNYKYVSKDSVSLVKEFTEYFYLKRGIEDL
jgi:hypothetical protein